MLWHVIQRLQRSRLLNQVTVATSDSSADNAIAQFASAPMWSVFEEVKRTFWTAFIGQLARAG